MHRAHKKMCKIHVHVYVHVDRLPTDGVIIYDQTSIFLVSLVIRKVTSFTRTQYCVMYGEFRE